MNTRITTLTLTFAALMSATPALADPEPGKEAPPPPAASAEAPPVLRLYGEPVITVPMGSLANVTGPGIGGMLGADYRLSDTWQLTGRGGYIVGSQASYTVAGVALQSSLSFVPVLAGARVYLMGTSSDVARLYGAAEGGVVFVSGSTSADAGGASATASGQSTYACGALSAGLEIDIVDLRVGLLAADLAHTDSSTAGLFSLGFRFASF